MKKYIPIIALLFCLWPSQPAEASLIQTCTNISFTVPAACTLTGVGAHHLIVAVSTTCDSGNPSDTFGVINAHRLQTVPMGCAIHNQFFQISWGNTGTNSGNDTCQDNSVSVTAGIALICAEYSENATLDVQGAATGTASGAPVVVSSGNVTTSSNSELLIAGGFSYTTTMSANGAFNIDASVLTFMRNGESVNTYIYLASKTSGAAGTYSGSYIESGNQPWGVSLFALTVTPVSSTKKIRSQVIKHTTKKDNHEQKLTAL